MTPPKSKIILRIFSSITDQRNKSFRLEESYGHKKSLRSILMVRRPQYIFVGRLFSQSNI